VIRQNIFNWASSRFAFAREASVTRGEANVMNKDLQSKTAIIVKGGAVFLRARLAFPPGCCSVPFSPIRNLILLGLTILEFLSGV